MEVAEVARRALEILDRDGWCRGTFTRVDDAEVLLGGDLLVPRGQRLKGSHCGGGIWSLAWGSDSWEEEERFVPLWEKVCELFPEEALRAKEFFDGMSFKGERPRWLDTSLARIVRWNDHFACEADVRLVFEKLAVG